MNRQIENKKVTREELRTWYDGYHTKSGERVYNPRSVVLALETIISAITGPTPALMMNCFTMLEQM